MYVWRKRHNSQLVAISREQFVSGGRFWTLQGKTFRPDQLSPPLLVVINTTDSPATVSHDLLFAHYYADQLKLNRKKSRIIFVFI